MDRMMLAPSVLLIVGTDTGVGKTWTGCAPVDMEGGVALARATGQAKPLHAWLRFRAPVAPSEAADREGTQVNFDDLVRRVREHAACADLALVEGAEAPRAQPVGDSGCGPHRARAPGRLDWLECCRHLPTLGLFPYPLRATHARPERHL